MKHFACILLACVSLLVSVLSCKTMGSGKDPKITTPPKYPIVLVHGIIATDRKGLVHFWGRIPEELEKNGVKVYLGNTDAWGTYESNAEILLKNIEKVLEETKSEKVNIIAHSMGGIVSRYLIWKYNYGDKVASLTTVSTPHRGAVLANLIYNQDIIHTKITRKALERFGEFYGDTNPDMLSVGWQLTTEQMGDFNEKIGMDPQVYYRSLYTTMKNRWDDMIFFNSYQYIKDIGAGDNDGMVSEYAATWGPNVKKIGNGISHAEIIDLKKKKISGIHIPDLYITMVNELGEMGF